MRADIIIITKCPHDITPMERRGIVLSLHLENWQKVFFTTYKYPSHLTSLSENPLLVTGIASPQQIAYDLHKLIPEFEVMSFPDHHNFTQQDIEAIRTKAAGRTILTTEKDATRLHGLENITIIPVEVEFLDNKTEEFNQIIKDYVLQDSRNSILNQLRNKKN